MEQVDISFRFTREELEAERGNLADSTPTDGLLTLLSLCKISHEEAVSFLWAAIRRPAYVALVETLYRVAEFQSVKVESYKDYKDLSTYVGFSVKYRLRKVAIPTESKATAPQRRLILRSTT